MSHPPSPAPSLPNIKGGPLTAQNVQEAMGDHPDPALMLWIMVGTLHWVSQAVEIYSKAAWAKPKFDRRRWFTGEYPGAVWLKNLANGHPNRFRASFGMQQSVFMRLLRKLREFGLKDGLSVKADEKLAIFLFLSVNGVTFKLAAERFERSPATISKHFKSVLLLLSDQSFYNEYVRLPTTDDPAPDFRIQNPGYTRFFNDCVGAIDGTFIPVYVTGGEQSNWNNRYGRPAQSVLAACDFDLKFVYVLSGFEGSTSDAHLYDFARSTSLPIIPGKYYLADQGFPLREGVITPYPLYRFDGQQSQQELCEIFNETLAKARSAIERTFGISKKRFKILKSPIEMPNSLKIQAQIPVALAVVHNFIRIHDAADMGDNLDETNPAQDSDRLPGHAATDRLSDPEREPVIGALAPSDLSQAAREKEKLRGEIRRWIIATRIHAAKREDDAEAQKRVN